MAKWECADKPSQTQYRHLDNDLSHCPYLPEHENDHGQPVVTHWHNCLCLRVFTRVPEHPCARRTNAKNPNCGPKCVLGVVQVQRECIRRVYPYDDLPGASLLAILLIAPPWQRGVTDGCVMLCALFKGHNTTVRWEDHVCGTRCVATQWPSDDQQFRRL
jgi:hypothetical protein